MSEFAIQAQGLTRHFGELVAVNGVDLAIPTGQIYGFLGPNGSGKTTIIRMLCGLITPTAGSITALDMDIPAQAEALRLKLGYMTQKFSLYDDLTIEENLQFLARIHGLDRRRARSRIEQLLERYALQPMRKRRADAMSGGQRQRLALAASTLHDPTLLFLDEPTSAVDPENRRNFWEKLFDLSDAGTTILVSTHYMDEAERCHQPAILETGRLRNQGTPAELLAQLDGRVVEVAGDDLRQTKETLLRLPQVQSAAQQGTHLRVLLTPGVESPLAVLQQHMTNSNATIALTRPSLEDVFVASTSTTPPESRH